MTYTGAMNHQSQESRTLFDQLTRSKALRICLFLPSLDGGGVERVFVELANEFTELGFRIDFALASAHGPYIEELSSEVRIVDFKSKGVLKSIQKLSRYLRAEKPDVLLSGLQTANICAILAKLITRSKTRCVISIRSIPSVAYRETRSIQAWLILQSMRISYRFANSIIANSEAVANDAACFSEIVERSDEDSIQSFEHCFD